VGARGGKLQATLSSRWAADARSTLGLHENPLAFRARCEVTAGAERKRFPISVHDEASVVHPQRAAGEANAFALESE
jgi:hypothetical protein